MEEILERRKIVIMDAKTAGMAQPYHYVEEMELRAAEKHLSKCMDTSLRLAQEALQKICTQIQDRGFSLVGAAILLSSARPLPELDEILNSHPLIHTAEGEFFRQAFRDALAKLKIPVTGIRESALPEHAQKTFGKTAADVCSRIDSMGRLLGPPWTKDQKAAALAAAITLVHHRKNGHSSATP
jgi:hypothetical protein